MDEFLKGLIIGFLVSAPIGPIGILCINSTLNKGRNYGLMVGFGASFADAVFAGIAGFGLTFISDFLMNYLDWFKIIGGFFLCYLGIRSFFSMHGRPAKLRNHSYLRIFVTTFFYTMTNPMAFIPFMFLFTAFGIINADKNYFSALMLVIGVFIGSILWWIILAGMVNFFRHKINIQKIDIINKIAGIIIFSFGIFSLLEVMPFTN